MEFASHFFLFFFFFFSFGNSLSKTDLIFLANINSAGDNPGSMSHGIPLKIVAYRQRIRLRIFLNARLKVSTSFLPVH